MAIQLWYRVENLSTSAKSLVASGIATAISSAQYEGKGAAKKGGTRLA
jgi:hypothetical protein